MSIKVKDIRKTFGKYLALNNVSIQVEPGEFLALLGPSGSGKTTLLRIISGLEHADWGEVYLKGESTLEKPIRERSVGFVFQHYALFRHMTVFENIAFGLRVKPFRDRLSNSEIHDRVMQLIQLVHLDGMQDQYPSQLSGGQRQRVALARVLAVEPKVMLLDEPFGALDAKVRKELRQWLRRLHDEMHITTIFVTHDQEEAMEIADRVAIMNHGKIVQVGTPEEIWTKPANAFVYDFLGNYNEFLAWKDEQGNIHLCSDDMLAEAEHAMAESKVKLTLFQRILRFFGLFRPPTPPTPTPPKKHYLKLFVRPFELILTKDAPKEDESVPGQIVHINPAGSLIKIDMERKNGHLIQAEIPQEMMDTLQIKKGDLLWVTPKYYKIFD